MNVTLRPCGHHLCRTCAGKVSDCPLCRVKISKLSPGSMALDGEVMSQNSNAKQLKRSKVKLSQRTKLRNERNSKVRWETFGISFGRVETLRFVL